MRQTKLVHEPRDVGRGLDGRRPSGQLGELGLALASFGHGPFGPRPQLVEGCQAALAGGCGGRRVAARAPRPPAPRSARRPCAGSAPIIRLGRHGEGALQFGVLRERRGGGGPARLLHGPSQQLVVAAGRGRPRRRRGRGGGRGCLALPLSRSGGML